MFRDRGGTTRTHEDPRVPRRPARHRHHRCRRGAQRSAAAGQGTRGCQVGHVRRRRRGAGLRRSAGLDGAAAGERHPHGYRGRGPRRPGGHAAEHGALRQDHQRHHPARRAAGRRHLPGPVRAPRAEAGMAAAAGRQADDPGPGQPRPRDRSRVGPGRPSGCDHRHRAQRLSEPGQQRPVLSLHLPRRARRRRHHHQRSHENRRGRSDRPPGSDRGQRGRRRGLWRHRAGVRSRLHHPPPVRPPPDPGSRPRGGSCCHGQRGGASADPRFRGVPAGTGALRVPLRLPDAAGVRIRRPRPETHRLRRGRGRTRPARRTNPGR